MPHHSDSESSPKSLSRSDGEEEKSTTRPEGSHPYTDPESPSNAQQSSDESNSSDGVLVELPGNPDQDSRRRRGDPDSGILVNIDGSMQEPVDESGREDAFEDASDQLAVVATPRSAGLEESIAVIEIGESSSGGLVDNDLGRVQARLEDVIAECRKYKEEREIFGKEVVSLRQNLEYIVNQHYLVATNKLGSSGGEDSAVLSLTPLHAMLNDCSKLLIDLKTTLDERINSESTVKELHAALNSKDHEIDDLNFKALDSSLTHDVVVAYLGSLHEIRSESKEDPNNAVIKRLLESLASVVGQEHVSAEQSPDDDISLVEKKTLFLIEKHHRFVSETHKLQQFLSEVESAPADLKDYELDTTFSVVRQELFESRRKETCLQQKVGILEEENRKLTEKVESMRESLKAASVETNKTKAELEQSENRLAAAKEKLSIAVTKGKSLVQHRDSLKQSLAEKASDLEKCMQDLQQKTETLQAYEANLEELKHLLSEKTSEHEKCLEELQRTANDLEIAKASVEDLNATYNLVTSLQDSLLQRDNYFREIDQVMSEIGTPEEVLSLEIIDRIRWFVNQKNVADMILLENRKIRDAMSSIELPENVLPRELDYQVNWLVDELNNAKDNIVKLQDEIQAAQVAVASTQSEMSDLQKEIDSTESSLMEEKLAKEVLHNEIEDLKCKYEETVQNLSVLSSDKAELMKALFELSESTFDDQLSVDTSTIIEKCTIKIKERRKPSLTEIEHFERMQKVLYLTNQELKLCEKILEDEAVDGSTMARLSDELGKLSNEVDLLKNEKESMQKELERSEDKCSLLREKLSMAVKKGKGLVQERENFKISLEEKVSEINNLKQDLELKDSTIKEYGEQIKYLSDKTEQIDKLEADIVALKNETYQSQQSLHDTRAILENFVTSLEKISLPTIHVSKDPLEKVNLIGEHLHELEVAKTSTLQELDKVKEEASLQYARLADASATIKSLEDELSKASKHISHFVEEKSAIQLDKVSIEQELEKLKEENSSLSSKFTEAHDTIKSLEDALLTAEKDIAQMNVDREHLEAKNKEEIVELNAKLAKCREELATTHGTMENYSAEINTLQMLINDESLFSMITEQFSKKVKDLKKLNDLIQNIHNHFDSKGLHIHSSMEHGFAIGGLSSLQKIEEIAADNKEVPSLSRITGGLCSRSEFLINNFEVFCKGLDAYIEVAMQALQATMDKLVNVLEHCESLKLDMHKLEAHNETQQEKLVSLQKEMGKVFAACLDATQELIEFSDSKDSSSTLEKEVCSGGMEEVDIGRYGKVAESLLTAAKRIKNQYKQLANAEKLWLATTDDLKNKLTEAELIAETADQEQMLKQDRVSMLERDLEALKELSSEMKIKLESYQVKENMLKDKEEEILSMQNVLGRGISSQGLSESQMNSLMDKVNKLDIPIHETGGQATEVCFSNPIEKLFYVVDKVVDMQQNINILTGEKKDIQLTLESHVREIESLRKAVGTININCEELELKNNELLEMTSGLERVIKNFGGYDALHDQKPLSAKMLLAVLDRLTTASSMEYEKLKSRAQELGSKLQSKDNLIEELSEKVKTLEDSIHARSLHEEITKERAAFEATTTAVGSEISEIEDAGPLGKNAGSSISTAAQLRTMRKGSNDHLILNVDPESDRLITTQESDAKGHVFKSLNTTGLIPKQGKSIADRIDGIWVSGGQILMRRPGARLGLLAYVFLLHLWLLGTII
ncbi:hypothetical protein Cni_G10050 [Canna indica]|uniref:Uncharacterized protein n=1 Tax=Canna indica TaxID=4628 RepID=A0AAQ3Q885_9LILI|nr:hypothetical protein Cni_G10050 [Canna indica]